MRSFTVGPNDADQRLDKFLKKLLPLAPLSLIYKLSRVNKVKVDKKRRDNDYRVQEGEEITLFLKEEEFEEFLRRFDDTADSEAIKNTETRAFDPKTDIVFEDESILVINKNPGVNVHPWDHKTEEVSLIESVQDYLGKTYRSLTFRPSLVHRIDRDTSWVIMIAKTKKALDFLLEELQNDRMEKVYECIVVGAPENESGTIRKKLSRTENAKNENKVRVDEVGGQRAVTHYEVKLIGIQEKYSLLECRIETGRMHQIRVHLASIGYPILGDKTYGDIGENSFAKRKYNVSRQMLHAASITFMHPETRKKITIRAPKKDDMFGLLER